MSHVSFINTNRGGRVANLASSEENYLQLIYKFLIYKLNKMYFI